MSILSLGFSSRAVIASLALGATLTCITPETACAAPSGYTLVGSFELPRSNSFVPADPFDVLPDGRILQARGSELWLQADLNGSAYIKLGDLGSGVVSSTGPSFVKVSPDGTRLAVGNNDFTPANQAVHLIDVASISNATPSTPVASVAAFGFDAVWSSNSALLVTGGDFFVGSSLVSRVDFVGTPSATVVVQGVGDGSGGVAIIGPSVYVGVGFGGGATPAGQVRSFDLATLEAASAPIEFTSASVLTQVLSSYPLASDSAGNLLIGGGDSFANPPVLGFAAVVDPADPANPLFLSPGGDDSIYSVAFNAFTNEALIITEGVAYRYAIPAPGFTASLLTLSTILSAGRRRSVAEARS